MVLKVEDVGMEGGVYDAVCYNGWRGELSESVIILQACLAPFGVSL